MDGTPPRCRRRRILSLLGVGLSTALAGCNTNTEPGGTDTQTEETEDRDTDTTDFSIKISTQTQPAQLPAIWADSHRIEDYQARFTVATSGHPTSLTVSNGRVELTPDSHQWQDTSVTVQPRQMKPGDQTFTATAQKNGATVEDTASVAKSTPENYKLDVVPERNEEFRTTIQTNSDEQDYLQQRGGFIEQDPVFDSYSSHEQLGFDKLGVDLVAREWRHDTDYHDIGWPADTEEFIRSIGTDTGDQRIKNIKSGILVINRYPNGGGFRGEVGSFEYKEFANAETVGEALDWLYPYYFNWQRYKTDSGPISSEDAIYAPTLEQAIEQKNNKNLEAHAWDFNLDEHGNGLIYGKNTDGSDELRIMETVSKPVTSTPQTRGSQLHPLVEESNYLNPDHDEFNRYWHPLRFGWDGYSNSQRWNFREEKEKAATVIANMTQSVGDNRTAEAIAPTTGYLQDFTEKLRTYNQNDADFEELYNQAKIMDKLIRDEENNHVIYGDTENPQYAVVEDDSVIDELWQDEQGKYDDFNQYLRDIAA